MKQRDNLVFAEASANERGFALAIALGAVFAVLIISPVGHTLAGRSTGVVTAVYTAYVAATLLTAWLLRNQFRSSKFAPVGVLWIAHAYGAAMVAAYLLAFPHVFAPLGLLGGSLQTAAWLWVAAHAGFFTLALLYMAAERACARGTPETAEAAVLVRASAQAATLLAIGALSTTSFFGDRLPALVDGDAFTPLLTHVIAPALVAAYAIAFALLVAVTRLRTVRNLWLGLVLVALACEVSSGVIVSGARFTYGWYLSCAEGAIAALAFLIVMLRKTNQVLVEFEIDNRTLADRTVRDGLTELLNRRGFDTRIADALLGLASQPAHATLLMLDIDHFKAYNDYYGHVEGDKALRVIGAAVAAAVRRPQDSCCRIGGDEFAVILPATSQAGGMTVAKRIHRAVDAVRIRQAPAVPGIMTVSIGVAAASGPRDCEPDELYARADAALYEAKHAGRNRTALYSPLDATRARNLVAG
jgi:diguanylate cyclase (GGDEF)-like protein